MASNNEKVEIWDLYNLNFEVIGEHVRGGRRGSGGRRRKA